MVMLIMFLLKAIINLIYVSTKYVYVKEFTLAEPM